MEEVWLDVTGYEGFYQVSSHGNVRSLDRLLIHNRYKHLFLKKGTQLKPGFTQSLYHQVVLSKDSKRRTCRVHTLVANAFLVKGENQTTVNHMDGNKLNNHVSNLEWCTVRENLIHAFDTGLHWYGEESKLSKLKETEVLQIVELRLWGLSYSKIARMFNVHYDTVHSILRGKTWCRLTEINSMTKQEKTRIITYYEKEQTT